MADGSNRIDVRDLLELAKRRAMERLENPEARASDLNAATALLKASLDVEQRLDERDRYLTPGGLRGPRPGALGS